MSGVGFLEVADPISSACQQPEAASMSMAMKHSKA